MCLTAILPSPPLNGLRGKGSGNSLPGRGAGNCVGIAVSPPLEEGEGEEGEEGWGGGGGTAGAAGRGGRRRSSARKI